MHLQLLGHATINTRHAWFCVPKLFPEEIQPCGVSFFDSLRNEWTTSTQENDWFTFNKRTPIESGLAIDEPMTVADGTEAELAIGEVEANRIVNFDEIDHQLGTECNKGDNWALR